MGNVNNKKVMGSISDIVNGNVNNKFNKSNQNNIEKNKEINNITKIIKSTKRNPKDSYKISAHEGINELKLLETTPSTPRETFKSIYDKGETILNNVTFYVKGFLPNYNNKYVTVENICWTKLLSWHCNIMIENNPNIIKYIGRIITCDIEIYPYPDNPNKFSFNIIGDPSYAEDIEYYNMISYKLKIDDYYNPAPNEFINNLLKMNIDYRLNYVNDIVAYLEDLSSLLYNNQSVILNLFLNTLFMSTDLDRKVLSDSAFVNKYFYDVMMILVKIIHSISDKKIRWYNDLVIEILTIIGVYTNSPFINDFKLNEEFRNSCKYLNVSVNQAKFYYNNLIKPIYKPIEIIEDKRSYIMDMKQNIINWCMTVNI